MRATLALLSSPPSALSPASKDGVVYRGTIRAYDVEKVNGVITNDYLWRIKCDNTWMTTMTSLIMTRNDEQAFLLPKDATRPRASETVYIAVCGGIYVIDSATYGLYSPKPVLQDPVT